MLVKAGKGKYVVKNEAGTKRLSKPMSRLAALKRLKQIEYFKNKRGGK